MIVSPNTLRKEISGLLKDIEKQIDEVKKVAEEQHIPPEQLRDASGNWVMNPLLLAKVQAISTLVELSQPRK